MKAVSRTCKEKTGKKVSTDPRDLRPPLFDLPIYIHHCQSLDYYFLGRHSSVQCFDVYPTVCIKIRVRFLKKNTRTNGHTQLCINPMFYIRILDQAWASIFRSPLVAFSFLIVSLAIALSTDNTHTRTDNQVSHRITVALFLLGSFWCDCSVHCSLIVPRPSPGLDEFEY